MEAETQGEEKEGKRLCLLTPSGADVMSRLQGLEEGILIEILSWLPVKTLLQLKSVCKRWNEVISSSNPLMVSMHLKNHTNNPASNASPPLIYGLPGEFAHFTVMQLYPDGDASQVRYLEPPTTVNHKRAYPMRIVSGPCNGIFLLAYSRHDGYKLSLWNPATGSLKELPEVTHNGNDAKSYTRSYGYGLDTVANDIKVVLILHLHQQEGTPNSYYGGHSSPRCPSKVLVYTLGTATWRELENLTHEVKIVKSITECYRCLNGCFFWLCASPVAALAFDLGNDVFRVINDPVLVPDVISGHTHGKHLAIYKDSLALFINQRMSGESAYDMWLLNQERWCWVKFFSIGPFIPPDVAYFTVAGCWGDDGKLLLFCQVDMLYDAMVLFDPATGATKRILQYTQLLPDVVFAYKDSLVSVGETSVPVARRINPRVFDSFNHDDERATLFTDFDVWEFGFDPARLEEEEGCK